MFSGSQCQWTVVVLAERWYSRNSMSVSVSCKEVNVCCVESLLINCLVPWVLLFSFRWPVCIQRLSVSVSSQTLVVQTRPMCNGCLEMGCWSGCYRLLFVSFPLPRKVEDLQFRVEEESITKGDLEVIPNTLNNCMWGLTWVISATFCSTLNNT